MMKPHVELPINQDMSPWTMLWAIPGKSATDTIGLLKLCGIEVYVNDIPPPYHLPPNPCRGLAAAIILQAIDDSLHGMGQVRWEARHWLLTELDGFPYYCGILDLDYLRIRHLLRYKLGGQWYNQTTMRRNHGN